MSEKRSTKSLFLIGLMVISFLTPVLSSASADEQLDSQDDEYDAQGIIIGDLADFDPADGRQYLLIEDCLLYTSPSPRDLSTSRMPSSA